MGSNHQPANILLYGAGSIGGVYLYQLLQAGCKVTAVCRSNYVTVKKHGFHLFSVRYGNIVYSPSTVVQDVLECVDQVFDFILVCTKSLPGNKPSLPEQLKPVLSGRPQTAIVLAQNGIGIEEEVAAMFPQNPILSGVVYCPAVQTGPGTIEYPEFLNLLELGTFPSTAPHRHIAERFADLMIQGGGVAQVHDDIQVARWSKLLMNAAWNPVGALTLTTDGDFLRNSGPYGDDLAWGVMVEIVMLAREMGVTGVTLQVAKEKFAIARKRAETGTGREMSMLQDVRQGRSLEVEAILGNTVRLARDKNLSMPRLETLYALTKARCWALEKEASKANVQ